MAKIKSSEEFIALCKQWIADYYNSHCEKTDKADITPNAVYVVWYAKALQNHKELFSTTQPDGMYYEATYNGDKNEIYFDAYKKWENVCMNVVVTDNYEYVLEEEWKEL